MPFLKGKRKKWLLHRTGVNHVHMKFDVGRSGVKVVLELLHRSEDERLAMFEKLTQFKALLEEGFEGGLVWDYAYTRESGQEVARIYTELEGVDVHRQGDWEEMYEFMARKMHQLETNLLEIRDLIKN